MVWSKIRQTLFARVATGSRNGFGKITVLTSYSVPCRMACSGVCWTVARATTTCVGTWSPVRQCTSFRPARRPRRQTAVCRPCVHHHHHHRRPAPPRRTLNWPSCPADGCGSADHPCPQRHGGRRWYPATTSSADSCGGGRGRQNSQPVVHADRCPRRGCRMSRPSRARLPWRKPGLQRNPYQHAETSSLWWSVRGKFPVFQQENARRWRWSTNNATNWK